MRDLPENTAQVDPIAAARRGARPALRRRFYDRAATAAVAEGYAVRLDDKPVRTPARRVLAAPTPALAEAIAAEWDAQRDVIDPAKMPLTRLANTIIDGVARKPGRRSPPRSPNTWRPISCSIGPHAPSALVERQAQHWDPILTWAAPNAWRRV